MKFEVSPGVEIESITIQRDRVAKSIIMHLVDGRHINLGSIAQAFTQTHFREVMAGAVDILPTKRPVIQWDAFCISMMQKAQHGGG